MVTKEQYEEAERAYREAEARFLPMQRERTEETRRAIMPGMVGKCFVVHNEREEDDEDQPAREAYDDYLRIIKADVAGKKFDVLHVFDSGEGPRVYVQQVGTWDGEFQSYGAVPILHEVWAVGVAKVLGGLLALAGLTTCPLPTDAPSPP